VKSLKQKRREGKKKESAVKETMNSGLEQHRGTVRHVSVQEHGQKEAADGPLQSDRRGVGFEGTGKTAVDVRHREWGGPAQAELEGRQGASDVLHRAMFRGNRGLGGLGSPRGVECPGKSAEGR